MKKKTAAAGATAVATGITAGVIGLLSSPAAAVDNVGYSCSGGGQSFSTTASVNGQAADQAVVGDQVTLNGVQAVVQVDPNLAALLSTLGETVQGTATLTVNAQIGDSADSGSVSGPVGPMPADSFSTLNIPPSAGTITVGAGATGELQFFAGNISATLSALDANGDVVTTVEVNCQPTAADAIDTVSVIEETEDPGEDPDDGTEPQDPDGDNGPPEDDGDNGGGGDDNGTGGGGDAEGDDTDPSGGGLARTGVDNTVPLTAGGAALLLLGGGLLYYSRRRSSSDDALPQDV